MIFEEEALIRGADEAPGEYYYWTEQHARSARELAYAIGPEECEKWKAVHQFVKENVLRTHPDSSNILRCLSDDVLGLFDDDEDETPKKPARGRPRRNNAMNRFPEKEKVFA